MTTINLAEAKGVVIPDGYEDEGLQFQILSDGRWFSSQFYYSNYYSNGFTEYKITLTLYRQLQGCLILPWMGGAKEVKVKLCKNGETLINYVDWDGIDIDVGFKLDPFLIAENEGEGQTITIERPKGAY
jgi:hypothetical protein